MTSALWHCCLLCRMFGLWNWLTQYGHSMSRTQCIHSSYTLPKQRVTAKSPQNWLLVWRGPFKYRSDISLIFFRQWCGSDGLFNIACYMNIASSCVFIYVFIHMCGPGSSVGIAADYGLDGPGSNPSGDEIFRPSRPAVGPTQPPVKWVPGLSRGKVRPGRAADHSPPSRASVMEE